jgi:hypothetical protein
MMFFDKALRGVGAQWASCIKEPDYLGSRNRKDVGDAAHTIKNVSLGVESAGTAVQWLCPK